jgi:hypothetical protein
MMIIIITTIKTNDESHQTSVWLTDEKAMNGVATQETIQDTVHTTVMANDYWESKHTLFV